MKTLKKYLNESNKVKRLTEFLNDNGVWQEDYIDNCEDFKNNYFDLIESGTIYLDNCNHETKNNLKAYIEDKGIDFLFENNLVRCEITCSMYNINNELWGYNIGEIEVQFTGLYDHETKKPCIYTELIKDMSENEIKEAEAKCEYYVSDDCIYVDRGYDRVSFILK
jgi:hypothetical protein